MSYEEFYRTRCDAPNGPRPPKTIEEALDLAVFPPCVQRLLRVLVAADPARDEDAETLLPPGGLTLLIAYLGANENRWMPDPPPAGVAEFLNAFEKVGAPNEMGFKHMVEQYTILRYGNRIRHGRWSLSGARGIANIELFYHVDVELKRKSSMLRCTDVQEKGLCPMVVRDHYTPDIEDLLTLYGPKTPRRVTHNLRRIYSTETIDGLVRRRADSVADRGRGKAITRATAACMVLENAAGEPRPLTASFPVQTTHDFGYDRAGLFAHDKKESEEKAARLARRAAAPPPGASASAMPALADD